MTVTITVTQGRKKTPLVVPKDKPVVATLRKEKLLIAPCGIGKCGKCRIICESEPTDEEKRHLSPMELEAGVRLACHTLPREGMHITLATSAELKVQTRFRNAGYDVKPLLSKVAFKAPAPAILDQAPDLTRLMKTVGATTHRLPLEKLRALPDFLRRHTFSGYATLEDDTLVDYGESAEHLGMIVDIGTTTVAAMLVDLATGETLAVDGTHNAQAPFGADVMTRIQYSMEHGITSLQAAIIEQLDTLLKSLLTRSGKTDISLISLAGNTTMMHLLCGLNPEFISKAPFIPASLAPMQLPAKDLGIDSDARAFLLPGVSAYIGADIVASLLATGAVGSDQTFLMADIGTNAETVLYANGTCYACSAAAGPCFEGANLSCGMPGQAGAIDSAFETEDGFGVTIIDDAQASGLCGSGVIDAIALLLNHGALDPTGRLHARGPLSRAIKGENNSIRFNLTDRVFLSQKDIREVQLAKAALRSGIEILMQEAGITADDIDTLYLAGGFGSAIHPESAARIGILPKSLLPKISVLGNAASFGALRYVTEKGGAQAAHDIASTCRNIELSAHKAFSKEYMARMIFSGD
ncbi:ferredoxin [Desulfoluna limicola]|uniref:Ferredoxin n=1 Tax=Desulfoluna limicola TaxID=2810562 RepID=A0ABM7PG28_9BACT|nr:ASKHA domain-containing protein [Desulfoluna limicola]BCS96550.1 ferredoxin [Desulfoluna limicola]